MPKPAAYTEAVTVEFAKAGIPGEVTTKVLKRYEPYLRWDPETKLWPALRLWLKHLGSQQLSARLDKHPHLLLRTPEECSEVYLWLAEVGIDAERTQQKVPQAIARDLLDVQSTVWAIQQALQLTDEQLPAFFKKHTYSLLYTPDRVAQTLQTVAGLLAVPVASKEMQEVLLKCDFRIFKVEPTVLLQRVSFFCEEFSGGQQAVKAALKQSIYQTSVDTMRARAAELKTMLSWTEDELNQSLNGFPMILTKHPSSVADNMQKLQAHSFTSAQASTVYAARPSLSGYDWSSPLNVEKLMYLMLVLQLTTAEIASRPVLLGTSFKGNIGPRTEFIYRSKVVSFDEPLGLPGLTYVPVSDARFAAKYNDLLASPPLLYNDIFKQHWWQRWNFLRHEIGLCVADISACRALLWTSLPNTLAPRWHFLTLLEAAQADFKAADHLTALATMSDEHFAQTFNVVDMGLLYDTNIT